MSNETKRDVFNELLKMYRNSMALTHEEPVVLDNDGYDIFVKIEKSYAAALPDDLPVIPEAVGEYIKANRGHMSLTAGIENATSISEWLWGKGFDCGNDSVFARAWVLGVWRV